MEALAIVSTTFATEATAREVARQLVEQRLAACAQIETGPLESFWRWEGKVEQGPEWRVSFKTLPNLVGPLRAELLRLHPYETPEFVVLEVRASPAYVRWARDACSP